ncbi:DNA polymerase III subunit gamma/tau [Corallococcus macrosporus]|uniref:DNA polymerase III subunit gamma/tau n=1 Tax=Corallococcus macrosporus TaxID=35 RepID=UPI001EFC6A21|nr:DNA polymerase III subunit gamma/tau [Corallococcus macrosporus]
MSEPAAPMAAVRPDPPPRFSQDGATPAGEPPRFGPAGTMRPEDEAPRNGHAGAMRQDEPPRASMPPGPRMDDLSPMAARPLSFLGNGGGAPPAPQGYQPTQMIPSGRVMEGLPPSAARPLSFLRNGGSAQPATPPPSAPPAGATPLSRTTEPAPSVRVTNIRRPEPSSPPEPPPYAEEEDARYYPEENSPEGCASGECLPEVAAAPPAPAPEPVIHHEPEPEPPPPAPVTRSRDNPNLPLIERWRAAVETVKAANPRQGAALANGRLMSMKNGEIVLGFLPVAGFHRMAVNSTAGKAAVDKGLAEHFGRPVKLTLQDVSPDDPRLGPSLAEQDAQTRAAHEKSTDSKVRTHPAVRAVLKFLGGEIEHIQVYEPERPGAEPAADTPDDSA